MWRERANALAIVLGPVGAQVIRAF